MRQQGTITLNKNASHQRLQSQTGSWSQNLDRSQNFDFYYRTKAHIFPRRPLLNQTMQDRSQIWDRSGAPCQLCFLPFGLDVVQPAVEVSLLLVVHLLPPLLRLGLSVDLGGSNQGNQSIDQSPIEGTINLHTYCAKMGTRLRSLVDRIGEKFQLWCLLNLSQLAQKGHESYRKFHMA